MRILSISIYRGQERKLLPEQICPEKFSRSRGRGRGGPVRFEEDHQQLQFTAAAFFSSPHHIQHFIFIRFSDHGSVDIVIIFYVHIMFLILIIHSRVAYFPIKILCYLLSRQLSGHQGPGFCPSLKVALRGGSASFQRPGEQDWKVTHLYSSGFQLKLGLRSDIPTNITTNSTFLQSIVINDGSRVSTICFLQQAQEPV